MVRFARIKERQKAYIHFYSHLMDRLNQEKGFEEKRTLPDGSNSFYVKTVFVQGRSVASFNFAFGRQRTFRIELYIDGGNKTINKRLYDVLYQRRAQLAAPGSAPRRPHHPDLPRAHH